MRANTNDSLRRPHIDGVRFLLFLIVFTVHYAPDPMQLGYFSYALPVFFVMSGFLITNVLISADHLSLGEKLRVFYLRRILRIVPAYFLVLGIMVAMGLVAHPGWYAAYLVNIKLFLLSLEPGSAELQAWMAGNWRRENWHLWSLSVEEQFYILYPLALYLTPLRRRAAMLLGLVVASIAAHVFFIRLLPTSFYGALLPVCMEYFAWGCLFAWLHARRKLSALSPSWTLALSVAFIALVIFVQFLRNAPGVLQFVTRLYQTPIALGMGFMMWALWTLPQDHPVARFLGLRPFVYFGEMSYTCYLVHLIALDIFWATRLELPFSRPVNEAAGAFVITMVLAMAIWHFFEKPIYGLRRFVPYSRPPAPAEHNAPRASASQQSA